MSQATALTTGGPNQTSGANAMPQSQVIIMPGADRKPHSHCMPRICRVTILRLEDTSGFSETDGGTVYVEVYFKKFRRKVLRTPQIEQQENSPRVNVDLNASFAIQYMHHNKKRSDILELAVKYKKPRKAKAKTVGRLQIDMAHVIQTKIDDELLVYKDKDKLAKLVDQPIEAKTSSSSLAQTPTTTSQAAAIGLSVTGPSPVPAESKLSPVSIFGSSPNAGTFGSPQMTSPLAGPSAISAQTMSLSSDAPSGVKKPVAKLVVRIESTPIDLSSEPWNQKQSKQTSVASKSKAEEEHEMDTDSESDTYDSSSDELEVHGDDKAVQQHQQERSGVLHLGTPGNVIDSSPRPGRGLGDRIKSKLKGLQKQFHRSKASTPQNEEVVDQDVLQSDTDNELQSPVFITSEGAFSKEASANGAVSQSQPSIGDQFERACQSQMRLPLIFTLCNGRTRRGRKVVDVLNKGPSGSDQLKHTIITTNGSEDVMTALVRIASVTLDMLPIQLRRQSSLDEMANRLSMHRAPSVGALAIKLVIIGTDSYVNDVLRALVAISSNTSSTQGSSIGSAGNSATDSSGEGLSKLNSARFAAGKLKNNLTFFVVPTGKDGENDVAESISRIDKRYRSLFFSEQWKQFFAKKDKDKEKDAAFNTSTTGVANNSPSNLASGFSVPQQLDEACSEWLSLAIHNYVFEHPSNLQTIAVPVGEAYITYSARSIERSVPFVKSVQFGTPTVSHLQTPSGTSPSGASAASSVTATSPSALDVDANVSIEDIEVKLDYWTAKNAAHGSGTTAVSTADLQKVSLKGGLQHVTVARLPTAIPSALTAGTITTSIVNNTVSPAATVTTNVASLASTRDETERTVAAPISEAGNSLCPQLDKVDKLGPHALLFWVQQVKHKKKADEKRIDQVLRIHKATCTFVDKKGTKVLIDGIEWLGVRFMLLTPQWSALRFSIQHFASNAQHVFSPPMPIDSIRSASAPSSVVGTPALSHPVLLPPVRTASDIQLDHFALEYNSVYRKTPGNNAQVAAANRVQFTDLSGGLRRRSITGEDDDFADDADDEI